MGVKKFDFLILGQGFAGTALGLELLARDKTVLIMASPTAPSASLQAVGLVNPVTGRRMAKTWNYENVVPAAHQFYQKVYFQINRKPGTYLEKRPIFKALHSIEEMNYLSGKSASDGYADLIQIFTSDELNFPSVFKNTNGWLEIFNGGRLDPVKYLTEARQYFQQNEAFLEGHFEPSDLKKTENGFDYQGISFSNVVSALGLQCPWIGKDLWAVKGQVFHFSGLDDWGNAILKTEKFIIPLSKGEVLMGSTYEREFESDLVDDFGFEEVTRDLAPDFLKKMNLLKAWTGKRPTTKDRLPVIRKVEPGLYLINGMGTKGVSLGPFASQGFIEILEKDGPL
jgi:glycine oxidase